MPIIYPHWKNSSFDVEIKWVWALAPNTNRKYTMSRLHNFILRISIWPVWLFFLVADLVFMFYVMPKAAADMKQSCGERVKVPDIEIGYTGEQLRNMLGYMNENCKALYYHIATITDSFYPLAYGFFFFFSIAILYYKTNIPAPKIKFYWFAIVTILFDYAENFTIAKLLKSGSHLSDTWLNVASVFSILKWAFAIACIVLIVLGVIRWLLNRFAKPQTS